MTKIDIQSQLVRSEYSKKPMSAEYIKQFDILSEMKRIKMASDYRKEWGFLDPNAKTPYCNN